MTASKSVQVSVEYDGLCQVALGIVSDLRAHKSFTELFSRVLPACVAAFQSKDAYVAELKNNLPSVVRAAGCAVADLVAVMQAPVKA